MSRRIYVGSHVSPGRLALAAAVLPMVGVLSAAGQPMNENAKLQPSDRTSGDFFGTSVAVSGTTAVIGAHRDDDNGIDSGATYLFDTTTGQQIAKLLPDDGEANDRFGGSVAISGSTAVIGATGDDDNGTSSGAAYLFDTTTGQQIAKLLPEDGTRLHYFGISVAISGTTVLVGASLDDDNGISSGSVYLFSLAMPCVADVNGDGDLTPTDFTAWINAFNENQIRCDQNGDGSCTPTDFTAWVANYSAGC